MSVTASTVPGSPEPAATGLAPGVLHTLSGGLIPQGATLHTPSALLLLTLLPLVWVWTRRRGRGGKGSLPGLSTTAGLERLPTSARVRMLPLLPVLRYAGLVLLIVALARPQVGTGKVVTQSEAIAIQVVVDRSGSMAQEMELDNVVMGRLDAVKGVLHDFLVGNKERGLDGRAQDLIGLVSFARFAETVCPMVRDPGAVVQLASALELARQRYEDGTAIGDGLSLAAARLHSAEQDLKNRTTQAEFEGLRIKSKVIVLLTDGDNNAGEKDPIEAAELAAQWGIKVYTIGIGAGSTYRVYRTPFGDQRLPMTSDVDEATLKRIAEITGGVYRRAQDGNSLREIYKEIDRLEKSTVKTQEYVDYSEKFVPVAIGGAALLALQGLLSASVLRRVS